MSPILERLLRCWRLQLTHSTNDGSRTSPRPSCCSRTDSRQIDYKKSLDKLLHLPWGKKAVRIAISIGQDADDDVLQQFTGNRELVLQANNPQALVKMIKWASTAASLVSAPASRPKEMDVVPAGNNTPSCQQMRLWCWI